MIKPNKYPPVDCSNNTQMVQEGLRPPFAFKKEDAWKNEIQNSPRKRRFFQQQTAATKKLILDYLRSGDLAATKYILSNYQGIPR